MQPPSIRPSLPVHLSFTVRMSSRGNCLLYSASKEETLNGGRRMRFAKIFSFVGIVLLPLANSAAGQSSKVFPKLYDALEAIHMNCNVPTGLDQDINDPDNTSIAIAFTCNDVPGVFEQLVRQRPRYAWSMEDGVYDVYSKRRKDRLSGLKIKSFALQNANRFEATNALDKLPEVQKWRSRHGEEGGVIFSSIGFSQSAPRISFAFHRIVFARF